MARKTAWRWAGRLWLLLVAMVWLACGVDGERAMTGACPDGEVCDPSTPEGLNFAGTSPSDSFGNTFATAVGGNQTYRIRGASGSLGPSAFDARSDDAEVLAVASVAPPTVTVLGVSEGTARLRIVNDDGELYDRATLRVGAIDRLELRTTPNLIRFAESPEADWVFLRGGRADVITALYDGAGSRLVDTSLSFAEREGFTPERWDSGTLELPADGDTVSLELTAGGEARRASAALVSEVQTLVRDGVDPEDLLRVPTVTVGSEATVCFTPFHDGRLVGGVDFEVAVEGPITADLAEGGASFGYGCVAVTGDAVGEATLTLRAPGAEKAQPIRVVPEEG